MLRKLGIGTALFLLTFVVFVATNWQAVVVPWYGMDDYYVIAANVWEVIILFARQGRPFYAPFIVLQKAAFAVFPSLMSASIFLHLAQSALHALTATIIGWFFVRTMRTPWAFLAMLPFLLWPLSEASLWISTIGYLSGSLLSVIGVYAICTPDASSAKKALGGLFIVAAALTAQTACLIGLSIFVIVAVCRFSDPTAHAHVRSPSLWILGAYVIGGAATACLAYYFGSSRVTDAEFFSWPSARYLFVEPARFLLWPSNYPLWIRIVQMVIFCAGQILAITALLIRSRSASSFGRAIAILLLMPALIIIPHIPLFVLGGTWFASRTFYGGPLALSAGFCLLLIPLIPRMLSRSSVALLSILLIAGYIPLSAASAAEHSLTFQKDIQRLRMLEQKAREAGVIHIVISNEFQRLTTFNPYHHTYNMANSSKLSAFSVWWASDNFVAVFSTALRSIHGKGTEQPCLAYCTTAPFDPKIVDDARRLTVLYPNQQAVLCYCP